MFVSSMRARKSYHFSGPHVSIIPMVICSMNVFKGYIVHIYNSKFIPAFIPHTILQGRGQQPFLHAVPVRHFLINECALSNNILNIKPNYDTATKKHFQKYWNFIISIQSTIMHQHFKVFCCCYICYIGLQIIRTYVPS